MSDRLLPITTINMPRSLNKKTIQWEDLGENMEKIHGLTRRNIPLWSPCVPMVPPKHSWVVATTCDTSDPLFIGMPSCFAPWWKVLIFSMLCWHQTMLIYWDIYRYICSLGTADEWLTVFHLLMNGSLEQWK